MRSTLEKIKIEAQHLSEYQQELILQLMQEMNAVEPDEWEKQALYKALGNKKAAGSIERMCGQTAFKF